MVFLEVRDTIEENEDIKLIVELVDAPVKGEIAQA